MFHRRKVLPVKEGVSRQGDQGNKESKRSDKRVGQEFFPGQSSPFGYGRGRYVIDI